MTTQETTLKRIQEIAEHLFEKTSKTLLEGHEKLDLTPKEETQMAIEIAKMTLDQAIQIHRNEILIDAFLLYIPDKHGVDIPSALEKIAIEVAGS